MPPEGLPTYTGFSSGGALALEAATRLASVKRLALFELPFVTDDARRPVPEDAAEHLGELTAAGRKAEALRYFFTELVALPAAMVALMRFMPAWSKLKALAPTLAYDAQIIRGTGSRGPLPAERWTRATVPTLVIAGGKSPGWVQNSMCALAQVLPNATHRTLERQTHAAEGHAASRFGLRPPRRPAAKTAFEKLSYTNQKRHGLAVEGAKTEQTRQRRLEKILAELQAEN